MTGWIQLVVNGILLGGFYALLGVGMTMIFGIVGLTNLAHGEFVILGAYGSTILAGWLGVEPLLSLIVTVPVMFLFGYVLQSGLFHQAMKKGPEPALLVTFGVSIILQDAFLLLFSADTKHLAAAYSLETLHIGLVDISLLNVVLFCVSAVFLAGLAVFLSKTNMGRAIRAVSDDPDAGQLAGIPVRRVYAVAMGIAMAMAAVAGLCVSLKWTFSPSSGGGYLLIAFIVVVIGGMGSIPGTFLAGIAFGVAQVVGGANNGLLISYIALLVMLTVRPNGLLGRK